METGLERLLADPRLLAGRRVGLIANPTTVDRNFVHAVERLADLCTLTALFGPEHGLFGRAQYMEEVGEATFGAVPVYSLYGATYESLSPPPGSLDGLDVVLFDIQDVGSRYYTYVWTMVLAMRACAAAGVAFAVLDRPNPLGGAFEGGGIDSGFESFVGLRSLPNRHGLTAGEIALWSAREEALDLDLTIVELAGWRRSMFFEDTGCPWVMPSPNMPTVDTAFVYPGMCLFEGTNISEGRGTTRPFELSGAPFLDGQSLAATLDSLRLPGVCFRPASFVPTFDKFTGEACFGVQQHVVDRRSYRPYRTALAMLWAIWRQAPDEVAWRTHAYEFVDDIPAFDLLAGNARLRTSIEGATSFDEVVAVFESEERRQGEARLSQLLYPEETS